MKKINKKKVKKLKLKNLIEGKGYKKAQRLQKKTQRL